MQFYHDEKTALFIDGSNLYASARALGFDIDYKKLLEHFASKARLVRAFYYTALLDEQEYSPIRPLVDWLDYNGFTMVTKPTKEFTDAMGRRKIKGNMDIELAIDVMEMAPILDHVVLFSGDGDFRRLVEAIQRKGVRVTVVSTIRSNPSMVADELRRQADTFVELKDLEEFITRAPINGGHQPFSQGYQPRISTATLTAAFRDTVEAITSARESLPSSMQGQFVDTTKPPALVRGKTTELHTTNMANGDANVFKYGTPPDEHVKFFNRNDIVDAKKPLKGYVVAFCGDFTNMSTQEATIHAVNMGARLAGTDSADVIITGRGYRHGLPHDVNEDIEKGLIKIITEPMWNNMVEWTKDTVGA